MKKLLSVAFVLLGMMNVISIKAEDVNKEKREIAEFTKIEAAKGMNIMLIQSDHYELEVVTQGCPTEDVDAIVKKGTLVAKMKKITKGSAVSLYVYYKDIEMVKLKTGATVETVKGCPLESKGTLTLDLAANCEAAMDLDVEELVVTSNSCKIALAGKARKQDVTIRGTVQDSEYDAAKLESEEITIYASGCETDIYATKSIKAEADGCVITCKGGAEVEKIETSGGQIVVK
ncbi:MAG: DUF2807 domain-containing protein [Bacteroidales bacterium]|nr:DUF2807 domain-containing protein [Bacteroidales bacterium]